MIQSVVKKGNPLLWRPSYEILDISESTQVVEDLWDTLVSIQGLYKFTRVSGLAAPQIGTLQRAFIMEYSGERYTFINPVAVELSEEKNVTSEGCLSFFDFRGNTVRHEEIKIDSFDESGQPFTVQANGQLSYSLQHELDHLDGVLYDSRLAPGEELRKIDGLPQIP